MTDGSARPECPRCGRPMVAATVVGPTEGYAAPCGCRMPPESLPGL